MIEHDNDYLTVLLVRRELSLPSANPKLTVQMVVRDFLLDAQVTVYTLEREHGIPRDKSALTDRDYQHVEHVLGIPEDSRGVPSTSL